MPGPIAVEIVADPVPPPELAQALIAACASAAGPGGCEFDGTDPQSPPRARVVVTFGPQGARVRVDAGVPSPGAADRRVSREVVFRDEDAPAERFRSAGLVAAGLVSELESAAARPVAGEPSAPPAPPRSVLLRLEAGPGWSSARPWIVAGLGGDFTVAAPLFLSISVAYGQTWSRDATGIAAQREALAGGLGVAWPLIHGHLEARLRAELLVNQVRASIHQPSTGLGDDGARTLVGGRAALDLVLPLGDRVGLFAEGAIDELGGRTTLRVGDQVVESIPPWFPSVVLGLGVGLP